MNRNRKLIASLVGIVALTNTVMPVCAEPSDTLVHANVTSINEGKKEKEQGNINLLDPSVGLVSDSNNMNNNGVFYQIQPNDTLSSIAKKNNTTVEKLMATAGITNPNKIKAGDILVSPYITEEFVLSKGQDSEQNEKKRAKVGEVVKHELTQSDRNILRSLFNAKEYAKMYPDVAKTYKHFTNPLTFEQKLFEHFINNGIWEGRQPSASFSVAAYASSYSDLKKAFGSHIVEYYKHYYNTTVIGNENRTITTVQKAQDAGIKVTDFSGNTVAVDEAGNIVTGEKADKIAAEKNLGEPMGSFKRPAPNVTVSADFNEETEKEEETQAPSSEDKKEPSAPVAPTKTFAEAYKEWLADKPVGGSANVMESWKKREPNLADYADGRAFLAKKEAWEKEMPDYDAYLATTAYASDYEAWQAKEPKLADYTILVGTDSAEKKYNEDFAKWQELAPKPEDYIKYTSFETDYNAWLAAAPVPVEGKYETVQNAMDAYTEAHTEWEANAPKQSDYFDEEGYNNAVTEWTNKTPQKDDYCDPEGYAAAVAKYERENPKPDKSTFFDKDSYDIALTEHAAEEPKSVEYFDADSYETACSNYDEAMGGYKERKEDYDKAKEEHTAYTTAVQKYKDEGTIVEYYLLDIPDSEDPYEVTWESYLYYYESYANGGYTLEEPEFYRYGYNCKDYLISDYNSKEEAWEAVWNDVILNEKDKGVVVPEKVEDPGEFTETPPVAPSEADYAYNGATDRKTADYLYGVAYGEWEQKSPSEDDDEFYAGYAEALANWEASYPKETDYYNSTKYDSLDAAKAAYDKAVADHEAAKPNEQDFVKESAGDATDKESALKAFEDATASYTEENPEPTKEEYTSNVITEEEKAEFEQAVKDYNAAEPSVTDSKYVEEAKETEEYKETVAKHEADKPDQSTYVDDIYETETDAVNAHEEDHRDWEGEKPSEYDYIINTTYADDLDAWVDSEPDFNEYFGIEAQE